MSFLKDLRRRHDAAQELMGSFFERSHFWLSGFYHPAAFLVAPNPATHTILTQFKAGETMCQAVQLFTREAI